MDVTRKLMNEKREFVSGFSNLLGHGRVRVDEDRLTSLNMSLILVTETWEEGYIGHELSFLTEV